MESQRSDSDDIEFNEKELKALLNIKTQILARDWLSEYDKEIAKRTLKCVSPLSFVVISTCRSREC